MWEHINGNIEISIRLASQNQNEIVTQISLNCARNSEWDLDQIKFSLEYATSFI
ncbi:hypothetical protein VCHA34P120_70186 [Vibrio chagasii]|nr:hypothetical protein VCHA34P120_70186 [Vibrio chagasii]